MSYKIIVLFRETKFYSDVHDFISKNELNVYVADENFTIYNFTDTTIGGYPQIINTNESVSNIINMLNSNNPNTRCIILDSCINYTGLNIEALIDDSAEDSYCLIKCGGISCPIVLSIKTSPHTKVNIINYDKKDVNIHCSGLIDTLFYISLSKTVNTDKLIIAHMLDIDIELPSKIAVSNRYETLFHSFFKLYYSEVIDTAEILALLSDSEIDIHLVFMIMRDFIIGREPEPELTQVIIDNYVAYTSRGNLILVDNIDILMIHDYISDQLINNNIIM